MLSKTKWAWHKCSRHQLLAKGKQEGGEGNSSIKKKVKKWHKDRKAVLRQGLPSFTPLNLGPQQEDVRILQTRRTCLSSDRGLPFLRTPILLFPFSRLPRSCSSALPHAASQMFCALRLITCHRKRSKILLIAEL